MTEPKWKQAERNRAHYEALGIREVYLDREDEKPWHLATHCKPGGSHRLEISTDVWFYADTKPAFRWNFDLEPSSANGAGDYQIDVPGLVAVLSKLRGPVRREFQDYLESCAVKVEERGQQFLVMAQRQIGDAATFKALARGEPVPGMDTPYPATERDEDSEYEYAREDAPLLQEDRR